jgi:hypothetical protein
MTTRFCPGCEAEVEDTGGFCLLGHRLALEAPVASLKALREEVDKSFEGSDLAKTLEFDERDRSAEPAMAGALAAPQAPTHTAPAVPARRVAPPPPPPPPVAPTAPTRSPRSPTTAPVAPAAPSPSHVRPAAPAAPSPFPVHPAAPAAPSPSSVRPAAEAAAPAPTTPPPAEVRRMAPPPPPPPVLPPNPASPAMSGDRFSDDPIASFAPAPRMDWGPERGRLKRLRRRKGVSE